MRRSATAYAHSSRRPPHDHHYPALGIVRAHPGGHRHHRGAGPRVAGVGSPFPGPSAPVAPHRLGGSPMNIFSKASAGLSLTPGQRAFLKLIEGFLVARPLRAATVLITAASN